MKFPYKESMFADLTLIGTAGAGITATAFFPNDIGNSTIALQVENSKVTVEALTMSQSPETTLAFSLRETSISRFSVAK